MQVLHLHGHSLIVIDEGSFLVLIDSDLLNKILSG